MWVEFANCLLCSKGVSLVTQLTLICYLLLSLVMTRDNSKKIRIPELLFRSRTNDLRISTRKTRENKSIKLDEGEKQSAYFGVNCKI